MIISGYDCWKRKSSVADRHQWVKAARRRFQLYCSQEEAYWTSRLERDGRAPPLWPSLSLLLDRDRDTAAATGHTAEGFVVFFARRVDKI